jgi:hypothetical protein
VHFRAPARFLALYVLAGALLAAFGLDRLGRALGRTLGRRHRRWVGVLLVGLVAVELLLCSEHLPHAAATAARAYTDLRPATAHLIAATEGAVPPPRFLSISKTLFDAGDEAAIEAVYGASLSPEALWAYKVAAKQREVLAPNLSLAFAVPAVDGYDGGLLPLRHYVALSRLLLPEGTLDGRLRENLDAIPEDRWLALLGVQWLITDKTGDRWVDDVVYDRQFRPALAPGVHLSLGWLPADFTADSLGLLYAGAGSAEVRLDGGETVVRSLPAQSAETARRVRWPTPANIAAVTLRAGAPGLTLTGASLIDGRTGAFYPLVLSEHAYLAHSGDVKIYEHLTPPPRAFFVPHARCVASDAEALAAMRDPAFDPWAEVLLHDCAEDVAASGVGDGRGRAQVVAYAEDRVVVEVTAPSRGVLVLTDAWYPGWRVTVRSAAGEARASRQRAPLRADLLFRAVPLEAGAWRVEFRYRSRFLVLGALMSGLGLVGFGLYVGRMRRASG